MYKTPFDVIKNIAAICFPIISCLAMLTHIKSLLEPTMIILIIVTTVATHICVDGADSKIPNPLTFIALWRTALFGYLCNDDFDTIRYGW